jgi:hypothetical protein
MLVFFTRRAWADDPVANMKQQAPVYGEPLFSLVQSLTEPMRIIQHSYSTGPDIEGFGR